MGNGWSGDQLALACRALEGLESVDARRLDALARLSRDFERALEKRGLRSPARTRLELLDAISNRASPDDRTVLVGLLEVPRLFRRLLESAGGDVTCLIGAPEERSSQLDDWGCPRARSRESGELSLDGVRVEVAETQRRSLDVLVEQVNDWSQETARQPARFAENAIAVVVAEPGAAPLVEEALAFSGIPHHSPHQRPIATTPPVVALELLWRYCSSRRLRDLVRLLRLPVIESWVDASLPPAVELVSDGLDSGDQRVESSVSKRDWISVLDRILETSAVDRVTGGLSGDPLALDVLRRIDRLVSELLPLVPDRRQPFATLADLAGVALETLYGEPEHESAAKEDSPVQPPSDEDVRGLTALGFFLEQCRAIAESVLVSPRAFVRLLRELVEDAAAPEGSGGVEVLGWLELPLDDAPAVAVMGLNEGVIPARSRGLLPDSARARLGLTEDSKRLARDAFLLEQVTNSREAVTLLATRTALDGEPALPSRLLLMSRGVGLAKSIETYFSRESRSGGTVDRSLVAARVESDVWDPTPPDLEANWNAPSRWRVTMFRDYLSCPYRFFLRHCAGLSPGALDSPELDAPAFGQLAHETLRRFALEVDRALDESELVAELDRALERVVGQRLAPSFRDLPPVYRIQLWQLRRRLRRFARWQVEQWRQGWVIQPDWVERPVEVALDVDAQPILVTGRIDRVDHHPRLGWRLMDYKTGDRTSRPKSSHQSGGEWSDLQLPLYDRLARANGLEGDVSLGLIAVSKDATAPIYLPADWSEDELDEATDVGREIVRRVRRGVFWPPSPSRYSDGLELVSGDTLSPSPAELARPTGDGPGSGSPSKMS